MRCRCIFIRFIAAIFRRGTRLPFCCQSFDLRGHFFNQAFVDERLFDEFFVYVLRGASLCKSRVLSVLHTFVQRALSLCMCLRPGFTVPRERFSGQQAAAIPHNGALNKRRRSRCNSRAVRGLRLRLRLLLRRGSSVSREGLTGQHESRLRALRT